MNDKLGKALGLVHIDAGDADLDLKLQVGDSRNFRRIVMNDSYRKDKPLMFEKFEEFMIKVIKRDHPDMAEEDIKAYVEFNCVKLFEDMMVHLGITSEDDMKQAKKDTEKELKKLIEDG